MTSPSGSRLLPSSLRGWSRSREWTQRLLLVVGRGGGVSCVLRALAGALLLGGGSTHGLASARAGEVAPTGVLYQADFEAAAGPEWSLRTLTRSPAGNRRFLGRLGNQTVTLTLTNLPPHTNLVVSFDLLILQSWDGNAAPGPDLWELRLGDEEALLLHTTFSNQRFSARQQAFPENHPQGRHPAHTGASEVNTLGYSSGDAVYPLRFAFPHTESRLVLKFLANGLQTLSDESWGLDNVWIGSGGPPQVVLASPQNETDLDAPADLRLEARVDDPDGAVDHVEFRANGTWLGTVDRAPFSMIWSNAAPGVYAVTARAIDRRGLAGVAAANVTLGGLQAEYFNNPDLTQRRATRLDPRIDYSWENRIPIPGALSDIYYGVRWTGFVEPEFTQDYRVSLRVDDGGRLWVDGRRVIDAWYGQVATTHSAIVPLEAGRRHFIQVEYNNTGCCGSEVHLGWQSQSQPYEIIPQSRLHPPEEGVNRSPNVPVIEEPRQADEWVDPRYLTFAASKFSDPNTDDSHAASDWEIWTVDPAERVWSALGATGQRRLTISSSEGSFEASHVGMNRLRGGTRYVVRTRHRDDSSEATSEWSPWGEQPFQTLPEEMIRASGEVEVFVPGSANLWLAGKPEGTRASTGDVAPGQSPVQVQGLFLEPGLELAFRTTGATVSGAAGSAIGPDGSGNVTHGKEEALSGSTAPMGSLIGVFLGATCSDTPTPPNLAFDTATRRDYSSLAPVLGQVFFIGDGRTSSGALQVVLVPEGAERLFLGIMDGPQWRDNSGVLSVTVERSPTGPTRNLLANGSFEDPGFDGGAGYRYLDDGDLRIAGWIVADDGEGERPYWNRLGYRPDRVFAGDYGLVVNQGSSVRTTIPVVSGRTYEVSFHLKAIINSALTLSPFEVMAGDRKYSFEPVPTWVRCRCRFTATATDPAFRLEFRNPSPSGDYRAYALDSVSAIEFGPGPDPAVLGITHPGLISIEGTIGHRYRIEFAETLGSPCAWREIATVVLEIVPQQFMDPAFAGRPAGFYRAVALP